MNSSSIKKFIIKEDEKKEPKMKLSDVFKRSNETKKKINTNNKNNKKKSFKKYS